MTIEGLGQKFQEARLARGLTLDEAARMTKIRPSRLAEIEGDDFSQFPSLAYAKGFLLIYGKFLDVDVTPYMEAFEGSEAGVTVDGYSYLQSEPVEETQPRAPIVRRRAERVRMRTPRPPRAEGERTSLLPLVMIVGLIVAGFIGMRFILNLTRLGSTTSPAAPVTTTTTTPAQTAAPIAAAAPSATVKVMPSATRAPVNVATTTTALTTPASTPRASAIPSATAVAIATPPVKTTLAAAAASEPEVRRAEPVQPEDLKAAAAAPPPAGVNRLTIRPVKKTYVKVVVDDDLGAPAFERWVSPSDGAIEFRGGKFAVRVLDRDAVQIKKNGQSVSGDDRDVTVE